MGCNYYFDSEDYGKLHIGKSSAGWRFLFRGHPDLGITTLEEWLVVLSGKGFLYDDYGRVITRGELLAKVARKMDEGGIGGDRLDPLWRVPFVDREFC